MKLFTSLRIRGRIAVAFVSMLVIIAVLGAVGLLRTAALDTNTRDITENYLLAVGDLGKMRASELLTRVYVLRLVHESDNPVVADRAEKALTKEIADFEVVRTRYEPTVVTAEERAIYAEFTVNWKKHLAAIDKIRGLMREKKSAAVREVLQDELRPASEAADAALVRDVAFNINEASRIADVSSDLYHTGRLMIGGLVLSALLVAALIGFWLARSIATPVQALTQSMGKLAERDLTVAIPGTGAAEVVGEAERRARSATTSAKEREERGAIMSAFLLERGVGE